MSCLSLSFRYKRQTCRHIRAWGVLRAMRQRHQQASALAALSTWALTGRHYRASLARRCLLAWREGCVLGAAAGAHAAVVLAGLRQQQLLRAWWQWVQDQVGPQVGWGLLCKDKGRISRRA